MLKSKINTLLYLVLLVWGLSSLFLPVAAEETQVPQQKLKTLIPSRVTVAPRIDGVLDDAAWQGKPIIDDILITYNPVDGDVLPQDTKIWMAYDSDNLYFAFYCYEKEPEKIKTSIARRDKIFTDDWIGLALDPLGKKQCLYEFFVNPNGIQGDLYSTPATGENSAPDWVWFSGGKIVADGYTVEIQIPLKSIRYTNSDKVSMNILFWRRISRLSMSGAWPRINPGKGVFNSSAPAIYENLNKQLLLEFIPTLTYGSIWDRENPDTWSAADDEADFGISARYGISSAITAELTYNPDFSQVESDAFQVVRNRRYPFFYSEKRPFFMEASDLFELSGVHNNFYTAVHTRKIVEPRWGARLTGDVGKFSFGLLGAADDWPGRDLGDEENYYQGKQAIYGIGRVKYGFNGDNHIGLLYTGKEMGDFYNRVFAADIGLRFGKAHILRANAIRTGTNDPETGDNFSGNAFTAQYQYNTRKLFAMVNLEKFDEDFRMDTAFYERTGISSANFYVSPTIIVKSKQVPWLKSILPVVTGRYLYDSRTDMADRYFNIGVIWTFIKEASLTVAWDMVDEESWAGQTFKTDGFWGEGQIQLTKWLRLYLALIGKDGIYYDNENPFLGNSLVLSASVFFQPMETFSLYLSYDYTDFNKKSTGEDVYDYHILYTRTIYQPNKHLFFRALVQYDSYLDRVMTDILASYEFVPGTVFHIGYGSLLDQRLWDGEANKWLTDVTGRRFYQTTQSFFVKISYRLQF